jgi:hypothetical protein
MVEMSPAAFGIASDQRSFFLATPRLRGRRVAVHQMLARSVVAAKGGIVKCGKFIARRNLVDKVSLL